MGDSRRLAIGVIVLLLVDVIWVASSELTKYIFENCGFDKPFFSTYLKTSMFSLYLLRFLFWAPWRRQCIHSPPNLYQAVNIGSEEGEQGERRLDGEGSSVAGHPIFTIDQVSNHLAFDSSPGIVLTRSVQWHILPVHNQSRTGMVVVVEECSRKVTDTAQDNSSSLRSSINPPEGATATSYPAESEPRYVPLKSPDHEKSSDAESDDSSIRSVRFSSLTEVRQMSDSEAVEAMLSRLSFSASVRAEELAKEAANKLSVREVMKVALIFCILWFIGNYTYQISLSDTEAGVVSVLSSTSGLFTLILAAVFPSALSDRFTLSKLFTVISMMSGVTLVSLEDIKIEGDSLPLGVVWALLSSLLYACYMVFLRRKVPSEDRMDFTMFFGFVGLFNTIILWPGFLILHWTGIEPFELPNQEQFLYLSVNGIIGTVLSELLWLWGCFLTSSLMATLSLSLTIPLTMVVDTWVKGVQYSWSFYAGVGPMMLSFIVVTLLTHYEDWDPLATLVLAVYKRCCRRNRIYSLVSTDGIERESLIVSDSSHGLCEDEDELDINNITSTNHV